MGEGETTAIGSVLGSVGSVFEAAIGWVGTVADTIAGEPILLLFVCVPLIGLGVGLFKRLLNVK